MADSFEKSEPSSPEPWLAWAGRLRPWHWQLLDWSLAAIIATPWFVLFLETLAEARPDSAGLAGKGVWTSAFMSIVALAARRRYPWLALAASVLGAAGMLLVGKSSDFPAISTCLVLYTLAASRPARVAAYGLYAALPVTVATSLARGTWSRDSGFERLYAGAGQLLLPLMIMVASWMIGYSVSQRRRYVAGLRQQAKRDAHALLVDERLRIARELHDIIAHSMSLITVRASVTSYVLARRPAEASAALSSIEQVSRSALAELRRMITVLRAVGGSPGSGVGSETVQVSPQRVPIPGLDGLDTLIAYFAEVGLNIELRATGELRDLPAGVGLSAYRIVQEALTNVLRHSGANHCQVSITRDEHELRVTVTDHGRGGIGVSTGFGHGLVGMRERAVLYGGRFEAGPLPGGGFEVHAVLPLAPESSCVVPAVT